MRFQGSLCCSLGRWVVRRIILFHVPGQSQSYTQPLGHAFSAVARELENSKTTRLPEMQLNTDAQIAVERGLNVAEFRQRHSLLNKVAFSLNILVPESRHP